MKIKYKIFCITLLILHSTVIYAQFIGHSGVYYLGSADVSINQSVYNNPNISGVVCRFRWENLETSPNVFNWSFIDGEILKATNANKKISLQPLGSPSWIYTTLGAQSYNYIDNNPNHPTYGQVLSNVVQFDDIYIDRVKNLLLQLSIKYANNPTISYINAIGSQISRNLPSTVVTNTTTMQTAPFWSTFNYNADTVSTKMRTVIDYFMSLFPNTPLWCSVDYVTFELSASNRPPNYLATQYTNYGLQNYPNRFGLFREDISGCTSTTPNAGNQWAIMLSNPCRTGAQMLWSVQDGPERMNNCGITPNTKQTVFDTAINKAIFYGMRYVEVYGADIQDSSLEANIINANNVLNNQFNNCNSLSTEDSFINDDFFVYPNPTRNFIQFHTIKVNTFDVHIYDALGASVLKRNVTSNEKIDISFLPQGIYLLKLKNNFNQVKTFKIIKE
jgi:hypothetical protein